MRRGTDSPLNFYLVFLPKQNVYPRVNKVYTDYVIRTRFEYYYFFFQSSVFVLDSSKLIIVS